MTYRVAADPAGTALGRTELHPHLLCSWTLDPASHRLSCAWAPPAAGWDTAFPSARMTATGLGARLLQAKAQA